ncbi:hypothetical protein [Streptomyces gardneri]|uniref:hypothetical protein n=1 Tax=Streptomyces gardneri TaxID=66892 RepID=UPI0036CD4D70
MDLLDTGEDVLPAAVVHEGGEGPDVLAGSIEFGAGGPDCLEAKDFVWSEPVGVCHQPPK